MKPETSSSPRKTTDKSRLKQKRRNEVLIAVRHPRELVRKLEIAVAATGLKRADALRLFLSKV